MYSKEEKLKAVQLFIKYGYRVRTTVRELGYPSRPMLRQWYLEYKKNGDFYSKCHPRKRRSNYTDNQIKAAVDFYLEHGRNLNHTISSLGYPKSHNTLSQWVQRMAPSEITVCSWEKRKVTTTKTHNVFQVLSWSSLSGSFFLMAFTRQSII